MNDSADHRTDPTSQGLEAVLRARHPFLHLVTPEETFAVNQLVAAAIRRRLPVVHWTVARGLTEGLFAEEHAKQADSEHPAGALRRFILQHTPRLLLCCDLAPHLDDPVTVRALREAIAHARKTRSVIALVERSATLPPAIAHDAFPVTIPKPELNEIEAIATDLLRRLREDEQVSIQITKRDFRVVLGHLRGLTRDQVVELLTDVATEDGRFDAADIGGILERKRALMQKAGILEHVREPLDLDQLAGFTNLKAWLARRRTALERSDLPFTLPAPRGVLLLGVPGTGKSACCKAIAGSWQRPLLRLDAGALYNQYIGESERRLRDALEQAEAMAPVVLWIDEVEKAFASAAARSSDGGLSQRMFGSLLTWMQDHASEVFLVATANEIEALPPELLRKGRFDEIFFIDLPTAEERAAILGLHLQRRGLASTDYDLAAIAAATEGHSGAELEQGVLAACFTGAEAGRTPDQAELLAGCTASPPLSVTMRERIDQLRAWSRGRCVEA